MATNVSKPAGIGTGRARRSEWRSVAYFTLHGFSFAGSTLLMTWGLFFLFFLALGGFSFDGYVVADAARTGAFLNMFAIAHMILSAAIITFRRERILPERKSEGERHHG